MNIRCSRCGKKVRLNKNDIGYRDDTIKFYFKNKVYMCRKCMHEVKFEWLNKYLKKKK